MTVFNPAFMTNTWDKRRLKRLPMRISVIVREVCGQHNVSVVTLLDGSRQRDVCRCRDEIAYRVKSEISEASYPQIGRWLGRDHTSLLLGAARHAARNNLPQIGNYNHDRAIEQKRERARVWWQEKNKTKAA